MNALNYYVTSSHIQVLIGEQAYLTRQIVLFDTLLCASIWAHRIVDWSNLNYSPYLRADLCSDRSVCPTASTCTYGMLQCLAEQSQTDAHPFQAMFLLIELESNRHYKWLTTYYLDSIWYVHCWSIKPSIAPWRYKTIICVDEGCIVQAFASLYKPTFSVSDS